MPDLSANPHDRLPDGQPVKRFYAVQEFFGSYFHQDWKLDELSADAVLARFKEEAPESATTVVAELHELLALRLSDDILRDHIVRRYDLSYDPEHDGMTMRQWLEHAEGVLAT